MFVPDPALAFVTFSSHIIQKHPLHHQKALAVDAGSHAAGLGVAVGVEQAMVFTALDTALAVPAFVRVVLSIVVRGNTR